MSIRREPARRAWAAAGVAALLGSLIVVSTPAYAEPITEPVVVDETFDRAFVESGTTFDAGADRSDFDPGYLISDSQFYDRGGMTESEIQSFLASKSGTCQNSRCLDVLRQSTVSRTANEQCRSFSSGRNERVSRIIYRVQQACGVAAQVLLVTLQKEQSLVTSTAPTQRAVDYALGYACPDTAPCNVEYAGIGPQLYAAAWQFQRYRLNPSGYNHQVGVEYIRYHPKTSCGTSRVLIRNAATAGLYNYTPYTPNSAAMSNLYGLGDSCSSYGNRNFWRLYSDWFGSPTGQLSAAVAASRISGDDRYATSVAVSASAYTDPATVDTVYIAVGTNFADGLAAAPAAAMANGPLLLTDRSSLPSTVRAEIQRLSPQNIVIVGGTSVVTSSVESALRDLAPTVTRIAGGDRYETARNLALAAFPDGADQVFIASGANFPDALAASAAAGALDAPVILVPPGASGANSATRSIINQLGATTVVAAGGTTVIRAGYLSSLTNGTQVTNLVRRGGADRYRTAALINQYAFPVATVGYMASGTNFPDALSAAAVAGSQGAPLHLSPGSCLPAAAVAHLSLAGVQGLRFVGGTAVLSQSAAQFRPC